MNCKQCAGIVYEPHTYRQELTEQHRNEGETPYDVQRVLDAGIFCSATCLAKYLESMVEREAELREFQKRQKPIDV